MEQCSIWARAGQAGGTQGWVDPRQGGPWALHLCKAAQASAHLPQTSLTHPMQSWPQPGSWVPQPLAQADPQELGAASCPRLLAPHSSLPALFICTARRQKAIALSHSCSPVGSDSCRRPTAGTNPAVNLLVSLCLYSKGMCSFRLRIQHSPLHPRARGRAAEDGRPAGEGLPRASPPGHLRPTSPGGDGNLQTFQSSSCKGLGHLTRVVPGCARSMHQHNPGCERRQAQRKFDYGSESERKREAQSRAQPGDPWLGGCRYNSDPREGHKQPGSKVPENLTCPDGRGWKPTSSTNLSLGPECVRFVPEGQEQGVSDFCLESQ